MVTNIAAIVAALATIFQVIFNKSKLQKYKSRIGAQQFSYDKLEDYYNKLAMLNWITYFSSLIIYFSVVYISKNYLKLEIPGQNWYSAVYVIILSIYVIYPITSFLYKKFKQLNHMLRILFKLPLFILKARFFIKSKRIHNDEIIFIIVVLKNLALIVVICLSSLIFTRIHNIKEELESFIVFAAFVSLGLALYSIMFSIDSNYLRHRAGILRNITITLKTGTVIEVNDIVVEGPFIIYNDENKLSFTKKMLNSTEVKRIEEHYSKLNLFAEDLSELIDYISEFFKVSQSVTNIKKKILFINQAMKVIDEAMKEASWRDRELLEKIFKHYETLKELKCDLAKELEDREKKKMS